MKRAGILLIVLAVLAAGFMAAANIVVADTGDEAHFESALLSGSREGVEGVRVSGRRSTRTVNDGYMDFVLGYDAASGVSESSFELGGRSSGEVPVDYGTYNFDIFDGLSSGGSSSAMRRSESFGTTSVSLKIKGFLRMASSSQAIWNAGFTTPRTLVMVL